MTTDQLAAAFAEIGIDELRRRQQEAARLLDQDGVVYNAYRESASPGRVWRLDPLPSVLESRDWEAIESGVIERAELLSLILEDLYGKRDLLRRRLLPPALIYGDPGFLRPCDGVRLPSSLQLFNYAADITRDEHGRAVVVADRSQAPSGAGFALENRTVISRVLPSLYRDAQVHRLAPFFRALRAALQESAPPTTEDPRIVVLTPGPFNETAFEHAALASTLGYPLVQGSDLTVRENRVWMRSVGQFEPVDVILRRVDGWFCDPLELRPDSQLGVPGLLEIAREGRVSIVNPIGASVLENPALMAFLPGIAQHLLGRQLSLPSVRTWWCGEAVALRYVLEHLGELVIRQADPGVRGREQLLGWEQSRAQLEELAARIQRSPRRWVAHASLPMQELPVLTDSGLVSHRSVLRAFAVARRDSYVVMPGGLTRVQAGSEGIALSGQAGAITKDTWVLASEPESLSAFWLHSGPALPGIDPMSSIPSRAAENLWWLGRYAERAEAQTRLLRTVIDRAQEFGTVTNPAADAALQVLRAAIERVADGQETLAEPLVALLECARAVRDQLSRDTWLVLAPLEHALPDLRVPVDQLQGHRQATLQQVMQSLLGLSGLGLESMVRDLGWHFMDAGRRLERSVQLLSLLQATLQAANGTATDSLVLESVLSAAESIITYRFRYRSQAQLETVLDLLLLDPGNPRSLVFQLDRLEESFDVLPLGPERRTPPEQRLLLEAHTLLRLAEPAALVRENPDGSRPALIELLARVHELLLGAGAVIDSTHFVHTAPTVALVGSAGSEPSILRGR